MAGLLHSGCLSSSASNLKIPKTPDFQGSVLVRIDDDEESCLQFLAQQPLKSLVGFNFGFLGILQSN